MKKRLKISLFVIGLCIMFISGYLYAGQKDYLDMQKEVLLTAEHVMEHDKIWVQSYVPTAWKDDLTEEEQKFLQKHVFGTWYFSERMIALEEGYENIANFSEQGIEEIKENAFTEYNKSFAGISGHTRNTFSVASDIYLFAAYGGMTSVKYPVYHIETEVDEERLAMHHIYMSDNVSYVGFPEEGELVHVFYDLGYDEQEDASVDVYYAADIYINPKDTDVIYLDFCGLWKLKRVED